MTGSRPTPIAPHLLPKDWRFEWEERAAIMEYDGGLSREDAERAAWDDIWAHMTAKP
jgi:hypothetical protein